ncbi:excalibur calcium-binding domain-containing protein [Rhodococcus sp. NPDC054953]
MATTTASAVAPAPLLAPAPSQPDPTTYVPPAVTTTLYVPPPAAPAYTPAPMTTEPPAPAPLVEPAAVPRRSASYGSCAEARNAGASPLYTGDPGYSRKLDRDGDGVACE